MSERPAYPSDLSDEQWALIEKLVPASLPGGRPPKYTRREVVNAILFVLRAGCAWRLLPHDLPQWETPYVCFLAWQEDGTWEKIEAVLRQRVRRKEGKQAAPTAGSLDSQTVKTSDQGGPRGFDMGKQTAGRKRHVLVDTLGLLWGVHVSAAHVQDREGGLPLLARLLKPGLGRLRLLWADSAYHAALILAWVCTHLPRRGLRLDTPPRRAPGQKGFVVQRRRWVVERTFAWLGKCRRLSKDYERKPQNSETMIRVASIALMLRRLAPAPTFYSNFQGS